MEEIVADWIADFEAAARRTLEQRLCYAFIHTYKPCWTTRPTDRSTPWRIIRSKEATGRVKDLESLPRLRAFREWWLKQRGASAPPSS